MPETIKVLGQQNPAATTLTALYTVPASTEAVVSSVVVANRTGGNLSFRLSVAPAGAADSLEHYLFYDVRVLKNDSFSATLGITLAATDVVRAYASAVGLSFNLFGSEVS